MILKIVDYCIDLDIVWLLTGRGSMLRNDGSVRTREESIDTESSLVYKMYKEKDDEQNTVKRNQPVHFRGDQIKAEQAVYPAYSLYPNWNNQRVHAY